jgi:hypothetical protein
MKKVVLLLMVGLLALPGLALANDENNTVTGTTVGEFQAIGELTGSYQVGAMSVKQVGTLKTSDLATHSYTSRVVPTQNADECLFEIKQTTRSQSDFYGDLTVKQVAAVGANDMFMKGGAAFCGDVGSLADTGFYQNQHVSLTSKFSGCDFGYQGITGSATYGASQTFQAKAP